MFFNSQKTLIHIDSSNFAMYFWLDKQWRNACIKSRTCLYNPLKFIPVLDTWANLLFSSKTFCVVMRMRVKSSGMAPKLAILVSRASILLVSGGDRRWTKGSKLWKREWKLANCAKFANAPPPGGKMPRSWGGGTAGGGGLGAGGIDWCINIWFWELLGVTRNTECSAPARFLILIVLQRQKGKGEGEKNAKGNRACLMLVVYDIFKWCKISWY